jgi:hypothetical protein
MQPRIPALVIVLVAVVLGVSAETIAAAATMLLAQQAPAAMPTPTFGGYPFSTITPTAIVVYPYPGPTVPPYPYPEPPSATPAPARKAARLSVVLRPSPSGVVRRGEIVTYTIVATNHGRGPAGGATIAVPFDPQLLTVLDAQFNRADAWVSTLDNARLEIRTGRLDSNGDSVTCTLRLAVAAGAPEGTTLATRLEYRWSDATGGGSGASNRATVRVGESQDDRSILPLEFGADGDALIFGAAHFAPGEPVTFWYNTPARTVIGAGTIEADAAGVARLRFDDNGLAAGDYSMVAYGSWTGITAVAPFQTQ